LQELRKKELGLAVISYDGPEILSAFSKQRGITFPLLSDEGSATIRKYGILNPVPEWAIGTDKDDPAVQRDIKKYVSVGRVTPGMVGVAFPGTFMLDRQGRVVARYFEDFYIERNTVSSLMMQLGKSKPSVAGTKISTGQLEITTYPSDTAVAPGNHFSIAVEVVPHVKIHLYAPGAEGYRVVALKIEPEPFIRALSFKYPPSETYFFKPLNEHVPVYQKPFTLLEDIVLEGTPEAQAAFRGKGSISVYGSLEYQACDDTTCFMPSSVPLSWTITLRSIVVERPVRP
jgi:peroxiredoxin